MGISRQYLIATSLFVAGLVCVVASPAAGCNGECRLNLGCISCEFSMFDTGKTCYDAIICFHCVDSYCDEDEEGPIQPPGSQTPGGEQTVLRHEGNVCLPEATQASSAFVGELNMVAVVELEPRM